MCKDEKKTTEAKVEDEKKLTEEELDKASGGSDPSYLPHIQPDGKYFPPAPQW